MAISLPKLISILILISTNIPYALSESNECNTESNSCNDEAGALSLKIIAIVSILVTSMIGVCLPLVTRSVPALHPDRNLFVIVKSFAAGIILATGFMHVLPDSFDMLRSNCLKENPWHKFPFSGFVAMLSAIVTLMVDSMATSLYSNRKCNTGVIPDSNDSTVIQGDPEMAVVSAGYLHAHHHGVMKSESGDSPQLLRYRVVAMVRILGFKLINIIESMKYA